MFHAFGSDFCFDLRAPQLFLFCCLLGLELGLQGGFSPSCQLLGPSGLDLCLNLSAALAFLPGRLLCCDLCLKPGPPRSCSLFQLLVLDRCLYSRPSQCIFPHESFLPQLLLQTFPAFLRRLPYNFCFDSAASQLVLFLCFFSVGVGLQSRSPEGELGGRAGGRQFCLYSGSSECVFCFKGCEVAALMAGYVT